MRRAFTYVAGDQWGIIRAGETDGIIGIFDNGVTTNQFLVNNFNGGDTSERAGRRRAVLLPLGGRRRVWQRQGCLSLAAARRLRFRLPVGAELFEWLRHQHRQSSSTPRLISAGTGTGLGCASSATSGCPTLTSGPGILDGTKALNQTALGVRYQGKFGDLGLLAYGVWEISGHANYTGVSSATVFGTTAATLGTAGAAAAKFNGKYDGLNFGSGGVALTYAGFTLGANAIGGRLNGQLALAPQGGVPEVAYTVGLKYVTGPLTVGVAGEIGWYQGDRAVDRADAAARPRDPGRRRLQRRTWLAGICRLHVPGHLSGRLQLLTGAVGSSANNTFHSQGIVIGNQITF